MKHTVVFLFILVVTTLASAQELENIVAKEWVARARLRDNDTYWEYTMRVDFQEDIFRDVRAEILWELTDTNALNERRMNNVSVWDLEGDYRDRSRTLVLEELGREDPNEFLSIWWSEMHVVFDAEGEEFVATVFKKNGNIVRDNSGNTLELVGRAK